MQMYTLIFTLILFTRQNEEITASSIQNNRYLFIKLECIYTCDAELISRFYVKAFTLHKLNGLQIDRP